MRRWNTIRYRAGALLICIILAVAMTASFSLAEEGEWVDDTAYEEEWSDDTYYEEEWSDDNYYEEEWSDDTYYEEEWSDDTYYEEEWSDDTAYEEEWVDDTSQEEIGETTEEETEEETETALPVEESSTALEPQPEQSVGGQVWPQAPEVDGEAVVLMEENSQALLYEKNAEEKMYPASTTKILTALVVLENCSLDETVTFTEECCDLEEGAVTIDSVPGEQMSLKDVLYGMLLPSGNDCAMALAIHVAGSANAFASLMNEKAEEIGAISSHFANPTGLFHEKHYTTASDLALIAKYAFQNSTFVDIISHATYIIEPTNMTLESRVLTNTHEMIVPGTADYSSDVIGGKTGYLYESGRCLVTYAERDGVTLLAVILNGSYYGIFNETQELLDFGWDHFRIVNGSESERKFSFAEDSARIQMDSSCQILTLNDVEFSDLTSKVNYAYYLDDEEYAKAKKEAGIGENDNRQLYAWIDYSYAGHYLGKCNIFLNPDMKITNPSFINVKYISIWVILLFLILILAAVLFVIRLAKKASLVTPLAIGASRRRSRSKVRYYSRSDSVDLRNQYVKSGGKDRQSIHDLNDIGVTHKKYVQSGSSGQKSGRSSSQAFRNSGRGGSAGSHSSSQTYRSRQTGNSRSDRDK